MNMLFSIRTAQLTPGFHALKAGLVWMNAGAIGPPAPSREIWPVTGTDATS